MTAGMTGMTGATGTTVVTAADLKCSEAFRKAGVAAGKMPVVVDHLIPPGSCALVDLEVRHTARASTEATVKGSVSSRIIAEGTEDKRLRADSKAATL
jgi:hypothetical protein